MSKIGEFFKGAFSDMAESAKAQKEVSRAEFAAAKAEAHAQYEEAKAMGDSGRRKAVMQAQRDEQIAEAKKRIEAANARVDADYMNGRTDKEPTLMQLRDELLNQPEPEAHDLALCLEMFTTGSLNAFAHHSNVDVNKRIISYDILELGEQMKSIGLLIMLDNIMNRVIENRKKGKYSDFIFFVHNREKYLN